MIASWCFAVAVMGDAAGGSRPALEQLHDTQSCSAGTNATGHHQSRVSQYAAMCQALAEAAAGYIYPAL